MNWTSSTQRTEHRRYWCITASNQEPERWQSLAVLEVQLLQWVNFYTTSGRSSTSSASSLDWDLGSDFLASDSPSMMSSRLRGQQEREDRMVSATSASPPFLWLVLCNPSFDTMLVLQGNEASRGAKNSLPEIRHLLRKLNWTSSTQRTEHRGYWCITASNQEPERWQSLAVLEVQLLQWVNFYTTSGRSSTSSASSLDWDLGSDFLASDSPSMMSSRLRGQQEREDRMVSATSASPPFLWLVLCNPSFDTMLVLQGNEASRGAKNSLPEIRHLLRKLNWTSSTQRTEHRGYWCITASNQEPERWQSLAVLEVQLLQWVNFYTTSGRSSTSSASSLDWDLGSDFLASDSPSMMSSRLRGQQEREDRMVSATSASPPFLAGHLQPQI
ncbi:uncharacterized protein LOC144993876 [Oryzias latipes]